MILSVHMHPTPSFTLFCKQIYYLEMIQLDSKFVTYFLSTCSTTSSPEKPQGRIQRAISLKYGVYRLRRRRIQISREQTRTASEATSCPTRNETRHLGSNTLGNCAYVSQGKEHLVAIYLYQLGTGGRTQLLPLPDQRGTYTSGHSCMYVQLLHIPSNDL